MGGGGGGGEGPAMLDFKHLLKFLKEFDFGNKKQW